MRASSDDFDGSGPDPDDSPDSMDRKRTPWWMWPNLVGLDAPLVAVIWLAAFTRAFEAPVVSTHYVVLFFAVWCLYTADRLIDVFRIKAGDPSPGLRTRRHAFMMRHRRLFAALFFFVGFVGAVLTITQLQRPVVGAGLIVMVGAFAYAMSFVAPLGSKKPLPGKEIAGGLLFAAGTTVPVFADYSGELPVIPAFVLYAALCGLNLLLIASKEGDLPAGPRFGAFLIVLGVGLAGTAIGFAILGTTVETAPFLRPLYAMVALSSAALVILQAYRRSASHDAFRVFADVALLVPVLPASLFAVSA